MQLHPRDLGELDRDPIGLAAEFLRTRIGLSGGGARDQEHEGCA
jgi:hypothetical protein